MIELRALRKSYRTGGTSLEVLCGVDLAIAAGELVSIVGRSGSGKTTLLHAIGGLDRNYGGTVTVEGCDLATLGDRALSEYRNRTVGFVFQSFYLLPHLTCAENVALPAVFARQPGDAASVAQRTREVLHQVGLDEKADALPATLSGGQRQRVAIARALFNRPKLMLCDEPTGNLDRDMGEAIMALFRQLNREVGITVVVVTHDPAIADAADRSFVVSDGTIEEVRPTPASPELGT